MNRRIYIAMLAVTLLMWGCKNDEYEYKISRIAFGSCCLQILDTKIFSEIAGKRPDVYIAMGDNVYADNIVGTQNFEGWLKWQYALLDSSTYWNQLRSVVPSVIATWDDHDYGANDAGEEFAKKDKAKAIFLDYWKVPATSDRYSHDGIYTAYYYGDAQHRVQVILLDTRWFRSALDGTTFTGYAPSLDPSRTMLGDEQWTWLEEELKKPAQIRIIGTSTQFGVEHNGYEAWANMPLQQDKMFETIKNANAEGVFMISGDVHYAELNKRDSPGLYPIYDMTSSGLTHMEDPPAPSIYRIGEAYTNLNFGLIDIDWEATPLKVTITVCDLNGDPVIVHPLSMDELTF